MVFSNERSNIANFQIIRAVAALAVVFDHTFATSLNNIINQKQYDYMHYFFNNLGWFGVNVFFVLSGYLMVFTQKEGRGAYGFLCNRIQRIYPAYLIYSIPIIIYAVFSSRYDHQINNMTQFIQNILLLPGWDGMNYTNANFPAWTLVYEMFFYFIFSFFLLFFFSKKKLAISISIALITTVLISRGVWGDSEEELTNISFLSGNFILFNFLVGCVLAAFFENKLFFINWKLSFLFILTLFFVSPYVATNFIYSYGSWGRDVFLGVIPAAIIIFISITSSEIKLQSLKVIGDASYSIYLTHVTFILIKTKISNLLGLYNSLHSIIIINLFFIPTVIILGVILYYYVEKPITERFKKINATM